MKKLLAGLIIVLMLGGIFGFAPGMAHAAEVGYGDGGPSEPLPNPR